MDILKSLTDLNSVGGRIRYYRLAHGLLQEDVATKAGIDVCTVKRYENNQREESLEICNKIAEAIGIDPKLLYDEYLSFTASDYGKRIKSSRIKLNLTQQDFGQLLGVHRKTVVCWEKARKKPLREHYLLLAKFL
ncbi:helix-turn-helix domain protein [Desulforamulus reducens MI-1]|uniref:Helix-turn-helix domain protein n=1 Tax=Desulforamulus reducens (strain ATCC BAA-1160 / DSM 100696 / MI-1) TaxID=349161 RepID=A4J378_DESRM|nr:helix-turn-helix transcriptional regulator [Desulforamulus reducens]ABO49531.1 helix-turn-helix domain protein [Desulforamulus reducens MI-1]